MVKFHNPHSSRQVRARARAPEGHAIRISAIPGQVVESPAQRIPDVVDLSRVDELGRVAVVDAQDQYLQARSKATAQGVVGVEDSEHEAAAVEVDVDGEERGSAVGGVIAPWHVQSDVNRRAVSGWDREGLGLHVVCENRQRSRRRTPLGHGLMSLDTPNEAASTAALFARRSFVTSLSFWIDHSFGGG